MFSGVPWKTAALTLKFNRYQSSSISSARLRLLNSALKNVAQHGWSAEAIKAGIVAENLPVSMIGLITPTELVEWFMEDANQQFSRKLKDMKMEGLPLEDRIANSIQARLEYVIPYRSRWHEGMALGAGENIFTTAYQVEEIVSLISAHVVKEKEHKDDVAPFSQIEKTAIGAVYVATELHLLTDESDGQEKTWQFLQERVRDLHKLAHIKNATSSVNNDSILAASAVATSIMGAAASLIFQPSRSLALSPFFFQLPVTPPSAASDIYSDLPPLPTEDEKLNHSANST